MWSLRCKIWNGKSMFLKTICHKRNYLYCLEVTRCHFISRSMLGDLHPHLSGRWCSQLQERFESNPRNAVSRALSEEVTFPAGGGLFHSSQLRCWKGLRQELERNLLHSEQLVLSHTLNTWTYQRKLQREELKLLSWCKSYASSPNAFCPSCSSALMRHHDFLPNSLPHHNTKVPVYRLDPHEMTQHHNQQ